LSQKDWQDTILYDKNIVHSGQNLLTIDLIIEKMAMSNPLFKPSDGD